MTKSEIQDSPGLNGVNTGLVMNHVNAMLQDEHYGEFTFRAENQWQGGSQNSSKIQGYFAGGKENTARIEPHRVKADQPDFLGGENLAPNPVEYVLHALGSCLTTTLAYHAAVQGIEIDGIESDYEGEMDARGFFGISEDVKKGYKRIRANMRVNSDASVETLTKLAMFSPVYEMLSRSIPVDFNLTTY